MNYFMGMGIVELLRSRWKRELLGSECKKKSCSAAVEEE
jgi:hypothetical protein